MEITPVAVALQPAGLLPPVLSALIPDVSNYDVLLMQPQGDLEVSAAGVWSRDRQLAQSQFRAFLQKALQTGADLAVTPEYSMPWDVLVGALRAGNVPAPGKLWALGCESIRFSELEALRVDMAGVASFIYEPLGASPTRFTDPLAYVFQAPSEPADGRSKVVVLVQFKTHPMADNDHFEVDGLQRGTRVYRFGDEARPRLLSLICSDAFAFTDEVAAAVYDRALVLHIQLNPKPRHPAYRSYRERLLRFQGDETELICLNWAQDVDEWTAGERKPWNNISGSAWYLKPNKFDRRDATLNANHRLGLYYTWLEPLRTHALFFNYVPALFLLTATKVAHHAVDAALSRRGGPRLRITSEWSTPESDWEEVANVSDGFSTVIDECGGAKDDIRRIAEANPLAAERVLALCCGKIANREDWHAVQFLDSCAIDSTEVIRRLTFCQDTELRASEFRIARLKRCANLWNILKTDGFLPPALDDFRAGFQFAWNDTMPHQNALSATGKAATVVYLGEEASDSQVERISKTIAERLQRIQADENDMSARQRLAVWFRRNGTVEIWAPHQYVKIDQTGDSSEFDIAREN